MVHELARAWVNGWVVSRGASQPVETPWGLRIEVGKPNQAVRYVPIEPDEARVRELAAATSVPATWIKIFIAPELVSTWLTPDWTEDAPGWLMAVDLSPSAATVPVGYTVATETEAGVTYVRVLAADGSLAARGQAAVVDGHSIADQISTEPEHQRRGLGSVVMGSLANVALDAGATTGVLGASVEGRALYESLGWKAHAPLAGFIYKRVD